MADPGPPADAAAIMKRVDESLEGLELEPGEASDILGFANRELPHLQTPERSYFVLGSYRDPYLRRLRIVQNELDKRLGTYPFLMADVREIDIGRLPTFRIRFDLLATYADYIVAVYERDAGGEVTELGKISSTPYFDDSYVLPRDYAWMTARNLETEADAVAAAVRIYGNDELETEERDMELESIAAAARRNDVDVTAEDLRERIRQRTSSGREPVSYSWVHVNEFRLFELHGRCHPWTDQSDLRAAVEHVP